MKVLFQIGVLCYRGGTVALEDYARYNQSILGNESIICYPNRANSSASDPNKPEVVENIGKEFKLIAYNDLSDIQKIIDDEKIDVLYNGEEFFPTNTPKVRHEAWQLESYDPRLKGYAYISKWLADHMNQRMGTNHPYVPHIIKLPEPGGDYREHLGIRPDQTVIGRIGGMQEFNLPFVHQAIHDIVTTRDDFVFVFVSTDHFFEHPNIRYIKEMHDRQTKSNFINTCDAMIHARGIGESFGIAIAEFLSMNKPVMAWEGGQDKNHTVMLKDSDLLYNPSNVKEKMLNIKDYVNAEQWSNRTLEFSPGNVMEKFKQVFLS
jgi:hypothetical protein